MVAHVASQLVRFLRLSMVGGEDAFLLESVFRNEVWDFMAEPISKANEAAVNDALASRCLDTPCRFNVLALS